MKVFIEFESKDRLDMIEHQHAINAQRYHKMLTEILAFMKETNLEEKFFELAKKHNIDFWR